MSHMNIPKEETEKVRITDGLIRMPVGVENIQDTLNDVGEAFLNFE